MGYVKLIQAGRYQINPFTSIALSLGVPDIYLNQSYNSNSSKLDRSKGKTTLYHNQEEEFYGSTKWLGLRRVFTQCLLSNSSIVQ